MTGREKIEQAFAADGAPAFGAVICYESIFVRDHWSQITDQPWWVMNSPDQDAQIAFYLARFIEQVRSIPADAIIVRQNWLRAYDFTTQGGALALNDYARANDPFAKVGKQQIAVEVSSVIRASPTSFRVAWIERRYQDGSLADTARWSAILTVAVQPPRDADTLRKNPLGIYINAINWSKELGQ